MNETWTGEKLSKVRISFILHCDAEISQLGTNAKSIGRRGVTVESRGSSQNVLIGSHL